MLSSAAAVIVLGGMPSRAAIIDGTLGSASVIRLPLDASRSTGALAQTSIAITVLSEQDARSLFSPSALIHGAGWGRVQLLAADSTAAITPPADATRDDFFDTLFAAAASLESVQLCQPDGLACAAGGNGDIAADAAAALARMPPGAGGGAVTAATGGKPATAAGVDKRADPGPTEQVPEPVSLALLALGLLGICVGIRKRCS